MTETTNPTIDLHKTHVRASPATIWTIVGTAVVMTSVVVTKLTWMEAHEVARDDRLLKMEQRLEQISPDALVAKCTDAVVIQQAVMSCDQFIRRGERAYRCWRGYPQQAPH